MLNARIYQHPVGQGGFSTGCISGNGGHLRWGYDCGSTQKKALDREIDRQRGDLAIFFMSHLHRDHVEGIDRLLGKINIDEVVVPYLNIHERLLLAAEVISETGASASYFEFVRDPAAFLLARGVRRIVYLHGPADERYPPEPIRPVAPEDSKEREEGALKIEWSGRLEPDSEHPQTVLHAAHGAVAQVRSATSLVNWILAPYAHLPDVRRLTVFRTMLAAKFPGQSDVEIATAGLIEPGRTALRDCYDAIWKDHNLVSMSLYAGPCAGGTSTWSVEVESDRYRCRVGHGLGWLATGDANLKRIGRRTAWADYYNPLLHQIAVFQVPHHGSRNNWHDDLLNDVRPCLVAFAAAGKNDWGHPHRIVRNAISWRTKFLKVGSKPRSQLMAAFRQMP